VNVREELSKWNKYRYSTYERFDGSTNERQFYGSVILDVDRFIRKACQLFVMLHSKPVLEASV
jgi:hypothetical protein